MSIFTSLQKFTSSGPITLGSLRSSFKSTNSGITSLSEYYKGGLYVANTSYNSTIPSSGSISFSNLYNAAISITATITSVEQNLDVKNSVFSSTWTDNLAKKLILDGYVISQNSTAAMTVPSGCGSSLEINLSSGGIYGMGGASSGGIGYDALVTYSNIKITGTNGAIAGGGGAGGTGGTGGTGGNQAGYYWQKCDNQWFCFGSQSGCYDVTGGDGGGTGGAGGVGQRYVWNGTTLTLYGPNGGSGGSTNGNGGVGGTGGTGGIWGTIGNTGDTGGTGGTGSNHGQCGGATAGSGGSAGSPGGSGGKSIVGYNRVVSISSASILLGSTSNN